MRKIFGAQPTHNAAQDKASPHPRRTQARQRAVVPRDRPETQLTRPHRNRPRPRTQSLDVEDWRVYTLERMRRGLVLVLLTALFVDGIEQTWPRQAVLWLHQLGGKLGHTTDADGPCILLAGIAAVWITLATIRYPPLSLPKGQGDSWVITTNHPVDIWVYNSGDS